jgi:hypothetical protein
MLIRLWAAGRRLGRRPIGMGLAGLVLAAFAVAVLSVAAGATGARPDVPGTPGAADKAGGANASGPYDSTRDGSPSGNGNGTGGASGRPCAGCVGSADDKNPPGQLPGGGDPNAGYECDRNHGVGRSNPAHTGCRTGTPTGTPTAPPSSSPGGPPSTHPGKPPGGSPPAGSPPAGPSAPPGSPATAVQPAAQTGNGGPLASTGFSAFPLVGIALVALVAGAGAAYLGRARRRSGTT